MKEAVGLDSEPSWIEAIKAVPDMPARTAVIYASKIATLPHLLNRPEERLQAAEALRMLIERIVLTPGQERGEIFAALHGELRAILEWTERQAIARPLKQQTRSRGCGFVGISGCGGRI